MNTLLQTIKDAGIPISSANHAAQYLGKSESGIGEHTSDGFYADLIEDISGTRIEEKRSPYVRYICKYLVSSIILISENTDTIDNVDSLLELSIEHTMKKSTECPEYFFIPETEEKLDVNGNVKPKKGSVFKNIETLFLAEIKGNDMSRKDAIALIVEKGLSSAAGASTHYAKCKKNYGT